METLLQVHTGVKPFQCDESPNKAFVALKRLFPGVDGKIYLYYHYLHALFHVLLLDGNALHSFRLLST